MNSIHQNFRTLWLDYLKAFITVLVVAHHASLAYTTFAWFDKTAYINSAAPIVDPNRWIGMDIFENFNDVFFMFLMFFIGGVFLIKSIEKKGIITFIKDRIKRLLIPFLFIGTPLMLVAYFPAYYTAHQNTNLSDYLIDFFTIENWPPGPPWFIGILFVFNFIFALCYPLVKMLLRKYAQKVSLFTSRPVCLFIFIFCVTFIFYVPLAYTVGAGKWLSFGPLDFQLSRITAYFVYFLLGAVIGLSDFNDHLFSFNSSLITKWKQWFVLSLMFYVGLTYHNRTDILGRFVDNGIMPEFTAWLIYYTLYVGCCTASCMGFIGLFKTVVKKQGSLWNSLSKNAYLIYLLHYIFVVWIQFSLMKYDFSALLKFLIVFVLSITGSWITAIALRKINFIKKNL